MEKRTGRMSGEGDGDDGRVDHAEAGDAINAGRRVDHTAVLLWEERAGRSRVVLGRDATAEPSLPLFVRLDGVAGGELAQDVVGERRRLRDGPRVFERLTKDLDVTGTVNTNRRREGGE